MIRIFLKPIMSQAELNQEKISQPITLLKAIGLPRYFVFGCWLRIVDVRSMLPKPKKFTCDLQVHKYPSFEINNS